MASQGLRGLAASVSSPHQAVVLGRSVRTDEAPHPVNGAEFS